MEKNIQSVLKMEKLVFDKINFQRIGFESAEELKIEITSKVSQHQDLSLIHI